MKSFCLPKIILSVLFLIFTITGCETNSSFLSNNKLKKTLQGTWQIVPILSGDLKQIWKFDDTGNLYITDSVGAPTKTGAYTVDAGFFHSYVNISGFKNSAGLETDIPNGKWTVVNVDDNVLSMTISEKCSPGQQKCGIRQYEFTKKQ